MARRDGRQLAAEISKPGFSFELPELLTPAGRIWRDIEGLDDVYESKGSVASPEIIATPTGLIYVHDLGRTLERQLATPDAINSEIVIAALNTTATTTFSFPLDHEVLELRFTSSLNQGNAAWMRIDLAPFGDPDRLQAWAVSTTAERVALAATAIEPFAFRIAPPLPIRMHAETDYVFTARSGAGGGTTVQASMLVRLYPAGLPW